MTTGHHLVSAFDQGNQAAKAPAGVLVENPFVKGSVEHNNFEVGRRFGAAHTKPTAEAMIADADEEEN